MKTHIYTFEKLQVWQIAKSIAVEIYDLTNYFPDREKFGLANQMRRASVSICSNIAEATGRIGPKDRSKFFEYSYSSALELLSQLIIAEELGYCKKSKLFELRRQIQEETNKLNSLRKKTLLNS